MDAVGDVRLAKLFFDSAALECMSGWSAVIGLRAAVESRIDDKLMIELLFETASEVPMVTEDAPTNAGIVTSETSELELVTGIEEPTCPIVVVNVTVMSDIHVMKS